MTEQMSEQETSEERRIELLAECNRLSTSVMKKARWMLSTLRAGGSLVDIGTERMRELGQAIDELTVFNEMHRELVMSAVPAALTGNLKELQELGEAASEAMSAQERRRRL